MSILNEIEKKMTIKEDKDYSELEKIVSDEDKRELAKGELSDELYDELFNYYMDSGEMPYGIAKARTGDPHEWILDRVRNELKL